MQILDQWNDNLEPEQKTKVLRENFLTLDRALQMTGLYILRNLFSQETLGVTSTASFTNVPAMQSAISSNGGLVIVVAQVWISVANSTATLNLSVDDQVVKTLNTGVTGETLTSPVTLFWCGNLPAGTHTIKIGAMVGAGTLTVGTAGIDSTVAILEYVKG
jgi:hypothetical protein